MSGPLDNGRVRSFALVAVVPALLACSGGQEVEIRLVTDLRAELDFGEVRAELFEDGAEDAEALARIDGAVTARDDLVAGQALGSVRVPRPGGYRVRVELLEGGAPVAVGWARAVIDASVERLTVRVLRSCLGVACGVEACVSGECVDARCGPDARGYCPAPECDSDDDCPTVPGPACLAPRCVDGACGAWPDDARCAAGSCDPMSGCPVPNDGGPPDGGVDAGASDACAGAMEVCNGLDDDCDGVVDNGASCPCEAAQNAGHTYLLCPIVATYEDALMACRGLGYDLVSVDDAGEGVWLAGVASGVVGLEHWIGLDDRDVEGTFVWTNGSPSAFRDWAAGEPNGGVTESCVHTVPAGAQWNDRACDERRPYVCEQL